MYWFLNVNISSIILYLLLSLCWAGGGWLLVSRLFSLRSVDRLVSGIAAGWLLWISLANLFAPIIGLVEASWAAALLILIAGVISVWRINPPFHISWGDFRNWPQLAWLAGLTLVFEMMLRGLAIYDEYLHLPIVSAIAAGDLPLHFPFNPTQEFAYHYGLQVWAAGIVRLANATPWFALDLAKAFALALTVVIGWLWVRRWTRSGLMAGAGTFLMAFGGGTLWLLVLLPGRVVQAITATSHLVNAAADTAPTIAESLTKPWILAGGGPFPFPFAFVNGIFTPAISQFANTGAMVYVTVLLLLLLVFGSRLSWAGAVMTGLLVSSLALSAEHLFFYLWIGLILVLLITSIRAKNWLEGDRIKWRAVLVISAVLALIQGGYITVVAQKLLDYVLGVPMNSAFTETIGLRWPPALVSQKFGALSLLDPRQDVLLVLDIGPVLLLIPIIIYLTIHWYRKQNWIPAALGMASFFCLMTPVFIKYGVEPSMVRFPDTAAWLWLFLGIPALIFWLKKARGFGQTVLGMGLLLTVISGIVIFSIQLIAVQSPQLSYFIQPIDGMVAQQYWNRLEPGAQVLSSDPSLTVTIFGREVVSNSSMYVTLPIWKQLKANPDPSAVAQAGYDYIYMDSSWWSSLSPDQRNALKDSCTKLVAEWHQSNTFRQLIDVRGCYSGDK